MSKFVSESIEQDAVGFGGYAERRARSRLRKVLAIVFGVSALLMMTVAVSGYIYWQSLKGTPQYSLAMLVDAAKRDDQAGVDGMVAIDSVVDGFMPQITDKAVEMYGRGLPPQTIQRVAQVAAPVMPAIRNRAKSELPRVIREKTEKFGDVPFAAMVIGADRYLEITPEGETALVRSKLPEHSFEVRMQRNGNNTWTIVGVRDEQLATNIARRIGQDIIAIAKHRDNKAAGEKLGVRNLTELLKEAEEIFK
jgi:hypothetical protein